MNADVKNAIRARDFRGALDLLDAGHAPEARDFAYHSTRGNLLERLAAHEEAADHYTLALAQDPYAAATRAVYGKTLFRLRRYRESANEILMARALSGNAQGCVVTLAKGLDKAGDHDAAIALLRGEIGDSGDAWRLRYALAVLLNNHKKSAEAIGEMRQVLAEAPPLYAYYAFLGRMLSKEEYPEEAVAVLKKADEMDGQNPGHLLPLGNALKILKRDDEAEAVARRLLAHGGEHRDGALILLSDVATAKGDHAAAAEWCDRIAELGGGREKFYGRRATIHRQRIGVLDPADAAIVAEAEALFETAGPQLDAVQSRVVSEITDKGYAITSFDELFGAQHQALWDAAQADVTAFEENPTAREHAERIIACENFSKDPFFKTIFKPSIVNYVVTLGAINATAGMTQMYLHPRILDVANAYNGMPSKLRNVNLWINPPIRGENIGERKGSQIWHRDQEDEKILKCFIYFSDVDEGSGATEYVPYSKCLPDRKHSGVLPYPYSSGYPGRYLMDTHVPMEDRIAASGPKGTILFIDTNGFHRGGYVTEATRILTMATYLRPLSPYVGSNTRLSLEGFDPAAYTPQAAYAAA